MPNVPALIGESWEFCRKQPAIAHVGFWFFFLPMLIASQFARMTEAHPFFRGNTDESLLVTLLVLLLLTLIFLWGNVCTLLIGKRLLQAKAGRSRSSFKAVRFQARPHYVPYLLTGILRAGIGLLWSVLLIVPGIVYLVRTTFYPVILVAEDVSYRPALRRSQEVVRGQFWTVLGSLIFLSLLLFIPTGIIQGIANAMSNGAPLPILLASDVIGGMASALASILFLLTLIQLYGYFRPSSFSN